MLSISNWFPLSKEALKYNLIVFNKFSTPVLFSPKPVALVYSPISIRELPKATLQTIFIRA